VESPFQDIRITGLDTHKSHDVPSQDGTHRLYLTLSGAPPPLSGEIFLVESIRRRVAQSGVRQSLTVRLWSLRVPQRNLNNIIWRS
jgi:hypothetical protein